MAQEPELMDCESKFPREVCGLEVLGRSVGRGDERHLRREFM